MTVALYPLAISVLVLVYAYRFLERRRRTGGIPLPPGPPSVPVLGHLFAVPQTYQEEVYRDWSRRYGWLQKLSMSEYVRSYSGFVTRYRGHHISQCAWQVDCDAEQPSSCERPYGQTG